MSTINVRNRKKADGTNNWEYRFEAARVDGKRKHISKSGFKTKKEALEAGTKALAQYNQAGSHFTPSEMSVSDYMDYWYENYVKVNCKYNTQINYARIIEARIKPSLGMYKLKALTASICQEWVNTLYINGGLAKNTLKGITATLSGALCYAVEPAHFIESSPMQYIRIPKSTKKKSEVNRTVISKKDFDLMCNRFRDTAPYYALMVGFYTGMRIGEVFGLSWEDIDLDNGTITVRNQIIKRNYDINIKKISRHEKQEQASWYFASLKTESSERQIKIGSTLTAALAAYKAQQEENERIYNEYYTVYYGKPEMGPSGNELIRIIPVEKSILCAMQSVNPVFRKENGEYYSTESFKYASRIIHHELGIDFNFHSLRHTHATRLVESGVSIKTVQLRLGHANITTTLQTYSHSTDKMDQMAVDSFENLMSTE